MECCELLRGSQTRIDLLFTMSEIPHAASCEGRNVRSDVSRTMSLATMVSPSSLFRASPGTLSAFGLLRGCATRSPKGEAWWSQTGSNRRPHACKARALPAELWPRTRRRMLHVALIVRSPSLALRRSSLRSRRPAEPKLQSSEGWWAWEDLNFRPHAYQARALTN